MRIISLFLLLLTAMTAPGQSGRTSQAASDVGDAVAGSSEKELTVKQMFDEANGFAKKKFAEFEAKKVRYTDELLSVTKLEQRQLAARYAAMAGERKDPTSEDLYYLGMLHWIAENYEGTAANLQRFIASEGALPDRRQTARSVAVVALVKQRKFDEAEGVLAAYVKEVPAKLAERLRMETELAKGYQSQKNFARMAPHSDEGYKAAKALLKDASSRGGGLDEILDAGMLVYEAYRDIGDQSKADAALDDLRVTAALAQSPSFYYYAVDQKIKYLIETGRRPAAMEFYLQSLINASKDFAARPAQSDVISRLKKREKHYKLLGQPALELPIVDQWFPGERKQLSDMKGKVVLLDFWATWCGPCFEAFPSLIEWSGDFKTDGLEILGVTRYYGAIKGVPADKAAEIEYLKQFRELHKLPYDFVVASDMSIQLLYGATALPTAVLIDRKGVIRYIESGTSPTRLAQIREMIVKLLAEK